MVGYCMQANWIFLGNRVQINRYKILVLQYHHISLSEVKHFAGSRLMSSSVILTSKLRGTVNMADFMSDICVLLGYYAASSGKTLLAAVHTYFAVEAWKHVEDPWVYLWRRIHAFISDQGSMYLLSVSKVRWRNTLCFITKPQQSIQCRKLIMLKSTFKTDSDQYICFLVTTNQLIWVPQIKIIWMFQSTLKLNFKLCVSQGRSFI